MPELVFKKATVSFTCPQCERRNECGVSYVCDTPNTTLVSAKWCSFCGARNKITCNIKETRKGEAKLKVLEFTSNDVVYNNKRFRVNQPNRKGKRR